MAELFIWAVVHASCMKIRSNIKMIKGCLSYMLYIENERTAQSHRTENVEVYGVVLYFRYCLFLLYSYTI